MAISDTTGLLYSRYRDHLGDMGDYLWYILVQLVTKPASVIVFESNILQDVGIKF